MTTPGLIETVYRLGGSLTLEGERIHYQLPESAGWPIGELKQHRDEVLALLGGQQVPHSVPAIERWLGSECVQCTHCAANPKILFREFCRWAKTKGSDQPPYEGFITTLAGLNWCLDSKGMVPGLCLAVDFEAFCRYDKETAKCKH